MCISSGRRKKGRGGSRSSFSTGSEVSRGGFMPPSLGGPSANTLRVPSAASMGVYRSNPGLSQAPTSRTKNAKSFQEPLSGNLGRITGTIGPIMQFSAPIPGATGPINLSQRTIVQAAGSSAEPSEPCSPIESNCEPSPIAISCQPSPTMTNYCPPSPPMPNNLFVPVGSVERPGKFTLLPMVLFPGCMDEGFSKRTDSKAQMHKTETKRRNKGMEGERVRSGLRNKCRHESDLRRETQLRREVGTSRRHEAPVNHMGTAKRQESQMIHEVGMPRGQESQVRFDTGKEDELAVRAIWCEPAPSPPVCKRRESSYVRKNEECMKRQESQARRNEECMKRQESQARRNEECPPATQEPQERCNIYYLKPYEPPPAAQRPPSQAAAAPPPAAQRQPEADPAAPAQQPPPEAGAEGAPPPQHPGQ